ncbi:hypothetical protein [Piscinibacter gummiphilus]|uniref:DUF4376 domain-containing protein n=1 Tax=Piscinibacter gummiphilus TaxID=946333 RepID=A0ABZ0CNN8_9BURK|nr:hypothetical protein [Piscinibacter gummiphilus]WOB06458.1 hypothetical protein RXV79_16170 [Piscinibacter gummiphilus]
MPIYKTTTTFNGSTANFHAVRQVAYNLAPGGAMTCQAILSSWPTQARFEAGEPEIARVVYDLELAPSATLLADAENLLIASEPAWAGGVYSDAVIATTLEQQKAETRRAFTAERNEIEFTGGFSALTGYPFSSDVHSQAKLAAITNRARKAIADADTGWSVTLDLADGTTYVADAQDVLDIEAALADKIMLLDTQLRTVFAEIAAATTEEELGAITWPA